MDSPAPRKKMACHCGWCGAVRQHDGTWDFDAVHDDEAMQAGARFQSHRITHGICPDCAAAFRADAGLGRRSQFAVVGGSFTRPAENHGRC